MAMDSFPQKQGLSLVWDQSAPSMTRSDNETWLANERPAELRQPNTHSDGQPTPEQTQQYSLTEEVAQGLLAHLSHEVRTPLNAILGYAEVIEAGYAGPLTESQRSYLQEIRKAGVGLIHELENLLDLAAIKLGKFPINLQVCDLYGLILEGLSLNRAVAAEKDIDVNVGHCEFRVRADSRAFALALANVLGAFCRNAIYRSRIDIAARCSGGLVSISIACDGRPIAENVLGALQQEKIFVSDPYRRAKGQQLGMELELPIAQGLINLQNANLTINHDLISGCEANITIPGCPKPVFGDERPWASRISG